MVNRNPVQQWFITFPQWNEVNIETFKNICPPTKWGYVVKEAHENGGIHFHLMIKLEKKMTKSKLLKWWETSFPNDYKRIDVEGLKDFKSAYNYLQKAKLDEYEWGEYQKLPPWLQEIKDEWTSKEIKEYEEKNHKRYLNRLKTTWESEHYSVYCYKCERPLPCEDHDGLSIIVPL